MSASLALLAEVAIVAGVALERLPVLPALGLHAVVVAGLLLRLVRVVRDSQDGGPMLLLIPAVMFCGPFGAIGGILSGRLARRGVEDIRRLEAWYHRLSLSTEMDPTARLADHVATGRAIQFDRLPAAPMFDLIGRGSVGEKQAILGIIARRFHPDYLPTLQRALISDEPVIRVQAAAVAAKIRGDMPSLVEGLLKSASDIAAPSDAIILCIREAELCARSGLMEAKDRERTERLVDGIMARLILRLDRQARSMPATLKSHTSLEVLGAHLLASERYGDYRRLRRAHDWSRRGPWTFRPRRAQRIADTRAA